MMVRWLLVLMFLLLPMMAQAQDLGFDYVGESNGELVFYGDREIIISEVIPDYRMKGWNPSGRYLMTIFDNSTDNPQDIILLHDLSIPESFPMLTDISVDPISPLYFGDERVLFVEMTQDMLVSEDEQGLGVLRYNVYEWLFEEGLEAISLIGAIPYGVGCGGGGFPNAIESIYNAEVRGDTTGQYNRRVLVPTPYGIVHNNSCTAIRTYLTNPETAEFVELSDNLRWSVVSPDGKWVAGTSNQQLHLVNLETLAVTIVAEPDAPVYSMTWGDDSRELYFVARTIEGELPFDDPNNVMATIEETLFEASPKPEQLNQWASTIYRYTLETGEASELYRADAFAIGNMTWVGDTLVFNQIGHPTAWLQSIIDGGDPYDEALIPVMLMQLDVIRGDAVVLGDDFRRIWVRPE